MTWNAERVLLSVVESSRAPHEPAAEPGPAASTAPGWGKIPTAIAVVLGAAAVAFTFFLSYPAGSSAGEIRSSGLPHGDFIVRPVECYTGGHWDFEGVWVTTETLTSGGRSGFKGGLKIIEIDGRALEAHVENPTICNGFKCQQRRVDRQFCRQFDVVVGDGKLWLRRSGHARIDCTFPEGGTLKVDLTFDGCAGVPSQGGD